MATGRTGSRGRGARVAVTGGMLPYAAQMATRTEVRTSLSTHRQAGPLEMVAEGLGELWSRRRLVRYLVGADLRHTSSNTLLGEVWWILDPLLQMAVYTILVTVIFQRSVADYPIFIFSALVPWKWFSTAIEDAIGSVTTRDKLIKQLQFPKIVLPASSVLAATYNFGFGLAAMGIMLVLLYPARISALLVLIPLVAVVQFALTFALALFAAAINVFFRDLRNVSRHALRLWFYLSPVLWSFEAFFPEANRTLRLVETVNPFYPVLSAYRDLVYYGRSPDWGALAAVLAISVLLGAIGVAFFKRLEPAFAKVL